MKYRFGLKHKFLLFIGLVLIVMQVMIFILANRALKKIVDQAQTQLYEARIGVVLNVLQQKHRKLLSTGLVEAYEKDFKESTVKGLRELYYPQNSDSIHLSIFRTNGDVIMHPMFKSAQEAKKIEHIIQRIVAIKIGEFVSSGEIGRWLIFKYFKEWDWIVVQSVPLDIKYADYYAFRGVLLFILFCSLLVVLVALYVMLFQILKPIERLTYVSTQMAKGNLEQSLEVSGSDELSILAKSFLHMQQSIKEKIVKVSQSEEKFRKLFEESSDGIVIFNIDGTIYDCNHRFANMLCGSKADILLENFWEFVVESTTINVDEIIALINKERELLLELVLESHIESVLFVDFSVNFLDYDKKVLQGIVRNISERKKTQELIVQTEKMLSVGGLAAGMAHEINNPLGSILQSTQNILRRISSKMDKNIECAIECGTNLEAIGRYLEMRGINNFLAGIKESAERAANIVSNMLSFSRKSQSAKTTVSLSALAEKTLDLVSNDYDLTKKYDFKLIDVQKNYAAENDNVSCVVTEIEQVLLNILRNAAHSLFDQNNNKENKVIAINIYECEDVLCLELEDNGLGMDDETKKRVFEPFFTTKPVGQGTGLGLSVAYFIIVDHHQGKMSVESQLGKGTKFTIQLPAGGVVVNT